MDASCSASPTPAGSGSSPEAQATGLKTVTDAVILLAIALEFGVVKFVAERVGMGRAELKLRIAATPALQAAVEETEEDERENAKRFFREQLSLGKTWAVSYQIRKMEREDVAERRRQELLPPPPKPKSADDLPSPENPMMTVGEMRRRKEYEASPNGQRWQLVQDLSDAERREKLQAITDREAARKKLDAEQAMAAADATAQLAADTPRVIPTPRGFTSRFC